MFVTVIVIVTVSVARSAEPFNVSMSCLLAMPVALLFPDATVSTSRAPVVPVKELEVRLKALPITFELVVSALKIVAALALSGANAAPMAASRNLLCIFMCISWYVVFAKLAMHVRHAVKQLSRFSA